MSRHAGPPPPSDVPPAPEPTFAERARTLVHVGRHGALATLSRKRPDHPFASVMPYAPDAEGQPLLLISTMAMHTQNLAAGRVTLMGEARVLPGADTAAARAAYLERHPNAAYWADFGDFGFWRLEVMDVYFVGGFAAMGWVEAAEYRVAPPDPLAETAAGIIEHMNRDHADALLAYARHFAGAEADEATMAAVDRLGFKLRLRRDQRRWSVRIGFPREVRSAGESRTVLIEMLSRAHRTA